MNSETEKDTLFTEAPASGRFEFNESVARVFDDMLARSVPLYRECQDLVVDWCVRLARPGVRVYDLGCSTGTLLVRLGNALDGRGDVHLVGLDNSASMIEKARNKLELSKVSAELVEADLESDFPFSRAGVVVLNYTLQFLPPERRHRLVEKIRRALLPGGGLLLIEKIVAESAEIQDTYTEMHHQFKRQRGYTDLEIARKKEALDRVLVPWTGEQNRALLAAAGFRAVERFFQWNNFAGFVALK
ncbi:MAG: carboxy-S-adenosyl-L-methionine synthase CmoA [Nitrospinaceae bacterium]|nr:carboxy-S-adenosyl-L-methionine synthase CmoA [Nitrospinaceae bacterium]NIR54052.1 carboxy-S-adenosyl-L-methionine synthase CmoA [Nitrospinaceae bacterium]NIS84469.1 carboxy-S-adenosyl-L-methionine synthase CmoA [Nitrospinaceae bacterium]NIT81265.1 carboxy-S-adenosyl-L-methionine synthase CmoA [Nitrospinaceae bacterium]NIU43552.1 carboxy-S-adenosyl-L-methionine synthase CmoA [Nitrospinaceae bacterium]